MRPGGEVLPAGVKVTVVADRGFADCKLFYALTTELAFEYVIRLRGDIYVTNARGERRAAAAWVGAGGRARRLVGARVTERTGARGRRAGRAILADPADSAQTAAGGAGRASGPDDIVTADGHDVRARGTG